MDFDSQHLISTKCKLQKQNAISILPLKLCTVQRFLLGRFSKNDIQSNTLIQIRNFGPYVIVTITS